MTLRIPDWDQRLVTWAKPLIGLPFEWGKTDCATLTLEAIEVLTGRRGQLRKALKLPKWTTEKGAVLASKKFASEHMLSLGCVEAGRVQAGCIVQLERGDERLVTLAPVLPGRVGLVATHDEGVLQLPLFEWFAEVQAIWTV